MTCLTLDPLCRLSLLITRSPEDVNIKDFEEHFIKTKDGAVVHAWLMLQPQPRLAPTIVYFHGNAGEGEHIGMRSCLSSPSDGLGFSLHIA